MPSAFAFRVRIALVAIAALLTVAFAVSPTFAQPGRPPRPPMPGRPPSLPSFPSLPSPHIGPPRYEWTCGKCKKSLGTTITQFSPYKECPYCGVTFNGTTITQPGIGGGPPLTMPGPPPGFGLPGGVKPPSGFDPPGVGGGPPVERPPAGATDDLPPPLPTNPALAVSAEVKEAPAPDPTPPPESSDAGSATDDPAPPEEPAPAKSKWRSLVIIGGVAGALFLLGMLGLLLIVMKMNASKTAPRPRRREILELDD